MTTDGPVLTGIFDGFSWIRCEGKGSFLNSPTMKAFGDARIAAGEKCLVVDLGACSGMDSTFMGTLAGMAARLSAQENATLQIADVCSRNQRSLEDLGLDFLMEIDPPLATWRGSIANIRQRLGPHSATAPSTLQRTQLVLEAHRDLASQNDINAETFSSVINLLESQLQEKRQTSE